MNISNFMMDISSGRKIVYDTKFRNHAEKCLCKLSPITRDVICMRYGLDGIKLRSLSYIRNSFGFTNYDIFIVLMKSMVIINESL